MARLKVQSGQDVMRILARHGFKEVRRRGSHAVMQRIQGSTTTTIPVPLHIELKMGTLRAIIRQNGLPRSEFEVE